MSNMKVIKSVEILELPSDRHIFYHYSPPTGDFGLSIKTEEIRGRRFVMGNGESVLIGMTKEAENSVGLVMNDFDSMQRELKEANTKSFNTQLKINKLRKQIKDVSFWDRIKFLFKFDIFPST